MTDSSKLAARRPKQTRIRDSFRFVGRMLKNPGAVGAVLPSSRYLAYTMVRDLHLEAGDLVLEYGPGTGPMTRALHQLDLPGRGVSYLGIELDEQFHHALSHCFPDMDFHHGNVEDIAAILAERGAGQAKYIISGLPFAVLPESIQLGIVDGVDDVLSVGGEFRTFQYVHAYNMKASKRWRAMMQERFGQHSRSTPVLRNVPPAYVLTFKKVQT